MFPSVVLLISNVLTHLCSTTDQLHSSASDGWLGSCWDGEEPGSYVYQPVGSLALFPWQSQGSKRANGSMKSLLGPRLRSSKQFLPHSIGQSNSQVVGGGHSEDVTASWPGQSEAPLPLPCFWNGSWFSNEASYWFSLHFWFISIFFPSCSGIALPNEEVAWKPLPEALTSGETRIRWKTLVGTAMVFILGRQPCEGSQQGS